MHGGSISAHSSGADQGSTLTVRLPLHKGAEPSAPRNNRIQGTGGAQGFGRGRQVSSADTTGQILLAMHGHQIELAYDGQKALEIAKKVVPDVIMLDIGMPGMNGYEVCRELREDPVFGNTSIDRSTASGPESDRQKSLRLAFDHHPTKPVDFQELAGLLAKHGS